MTSADDSSELAEARRRLVELEAVEAERAQAAKVQDALYRIAELAGAARDLQKFYRAIHGVVAELMYASNFYLALYDEERRLISWPYYVDEVDTDLPDPNRWDQFGSGDARGVTAYVLRTGEPQHLAGEGIEKLAELGEIDVVGDLSVDWVGVPLKSDDGRTVGVLAVQSYLPEVRFTEQDEQLLAFVGQHVGAALSRAQAIEETRQRNAELALINSVQEALAGELELQAIYDAVGDKIRDVFDAQVLDIAIYDEPSGLLHFAYAIERGTRFPREPIELIGLRKHVMQTRFDHRFAFALPFGLASAHAGVWQYHPAATLSGAALAASARSRAATAPSFAGPLHQPGAGFPTGTDESCSSVLSFHMAPRGAPSTRMGSCSRACVGACR